MKHIIAVFIIALLATALNAQTYQAGGNMGAFTTSGVSIAPGETVTFGISLAGTSSIMATEIPDGPLHKCLPGDRRASKIPVDALHFWSGPPCDFRDTSMNPIQLLRVRKHKEEWL